jgi:hypothetical protein
VNANLAGRLASLTAHSICRRYRFKGPLSSAQRTFRLCYGLLSLDPNSAMKITSALSLLIVFGIHAGPLQSESGSCRHRESRSTAQIKSTTEYHKGATQAQESAVKLLTEYLSAPKDAPTPSGNAGAHHQLTELEQNSKGSGSFTYYCGDYED